MNLAQCYEAEFSSLTHKQPDSSGVFELDTHPGEFVQCYILTIKDIPAGIAAIALNDEHSYEMREFYVVPYFRKMAWVRILRINCGEYIQENGRSNRLNMPNTPERFGVKQSVNIKILLIWKISMSTHIGVWSLDKNF